MTTYIAFLRGINLGGRNRIKMQELTRIVSQAGFRNVRTYIQSGNIIFNATSTNAGAVRRKLERVLESTGYRITVAVTTLSDLKKLTRSKLFKQVTRQTDAVPFVVFLADEWKSKTKMPLRLEKENLTMTAIIDRAALVIAGPKKNGKFAFPNAFIEKELGVLATTRNLNTVNKIVALAEEGKNND